MSRCSHERTQHGIWECLGPNGGGKSRPDEFGGFNGTGSFYSCLPVKVKTGGLH